MPPSSLARLMLAGVLVLAGMPVGRWAFARWEATGFAACYVVQSVCWLLGCRIVWRQRRCGTAALTGVLGIALACRLVVLFSPPLLSSDAYRYVWDGKLVVNGVNPFRYVPADPHLTGLRDERIYPLINRAASTHTIYPPAAQATFAAGYLLSGDSVLGVKVVMVACEIVAALALILALQASGQDSARIVLYAWSPLAIWEVAGGGHVDAVAVAAIALALLAHVRQRPGWVGFWLALGFLTKFYPAVLLPLFWGRGEHQGRVRMLVVFLMTSALAYLPFLSVGSGILGYLPNYWREEGCVSGRRYFPLQLVRYVLPLPTMVYVAGAGAVVAAVTIRQRRRLERRWKALGAAGSDLVGSVLLLGTPHYPWYFLWLLPFACLAPSGAWVYLLAGCGLQYLAGVGSEDPRRTLVVGAAVYLPVYLLLLAERRLLRSPVLGP